MMNFFKFLERKGTVLVFCLAAIVLLSVLCAFWAGIVSVFGAAVTAIVTLAGLMFGANVAGKFSKNDSSQTNKPEGQ